MIINSVASGRLERLIIHNPFNGGEVPVIPVLGDGGHIIAETWLPVYARAESRTQERYFQNSKYCATQPAGMQATYGGGGGLTGLGFPPEAAKFRSSRA